MRKIMRKTGVGAFAERRQGVRRTSVQRCESSASFAKIGNDPAVILLELPYGSREIAEPPPTSREQKRLTGTFQFGLDFYQSNAEVTLRLSGDELVLRWPSGGISPLIPISTNQFIDPPIGRSSRSDRTRPTAA